MWAGEFGEFVMGHDTLNNTAQHVVYSGGPYDSRLLLPLSSHT
jgi:hypothetical protein